MGSNEEWLIPHSSSGADTQRLPPGPYWAWAARQEAGVWFVKHGPRLQSSLRSCYTSFSPQKKRGWVEEAALTVCSEQTHLSDLRLCCCVMEREWGTKGVKCPPSSTEQVVSRLCWNLRPLPPSSGWVWRGSHTDTTLKPKPSQQRPVAPVELQIRCSHTWHPNKLQRGCAIWTKVCGHFQSSQNKLSYHYILELDVQTSTPSDTFGLNWSQASSPNITGQPQ